MSNVFKCRRLNANKNMKSSLKVGLTRLEERVWGMGFEDCSASKRTLNVLDDREGKEEVEADSQRDIYHYVLSTASL